MKIGVPCLNLKSSRHAAQKKGKRAGYARAVACEALEERWGSDEDIDESRSHLNAYIVMPEWEGMGFESGQVLSDWWEAEAARQVRIVRVRVPVRDEDGEKVKGADGKVVYEVDADGNFIYEEHERKLRSDAGIGFAVIAKADSEWLNSLPADVQERFIEDLVAVTCDVLREHGLIVQAVAIHRDEQGIHPHFLGYDPAYQMGDKLALPLFGAFNAEIPKRMRELGWDEVEDCVAYDKEKVEAEIAELTEGLDEEQAAEKRQEYMDNLIAKKKAKKKAGRSSKRYKADRDEERSRQAQDAAKEAEKAVDNWAAHVESLSGKRDIIMEQAQDAARQRDETLDDMYALKAGYAEMLSEFDAVAEDVRGEMMATEQMLQEAVFEAEAMVRDAEVDAERIRTEAASRLDEREKGLDAREKGIADRESTVDQGMAFVRERTRSLDYYAGELEQRAERLADVESDTCYTFLRDAVSSDEGMASLLGLPGPHGKSADDMVREREPRNYAMRQRLMGWVTGVVRTAVTAALDWWERHHSRSLETAMEAEDAAFEDELRSWQQDGVDGVDGHARELE